MDIFSLQGKTALVTGGTRGIGAQMAIALAEAGADIILVQVCQSRRKMGNVSPQLLKPFSETSGTTLSKLLLKTWAGGLQST